METDPSPSQATATPSEQPVDHSTVEAAENFTPEVPTLGDPGVYGGYYPMSPEETLTGRVIPSFGDEPANTVEQTAQPAPDALTAADFPGGVMPLPAIPIGLMRQYSCHKIVHAFKIGDIRMSPVDEPAPKDSGGTWKIAPVLPEDEQQQFNVTVSHAWYSKHLPEVGGYFVVYADGYFSYSPADAFEGGYTMIPESASPEELSSQSLTASQVNAAQPEADPIHHNSYVRDLIAKEIARLRSLAAEPGLLKLEHAVAGFFHKL